MDTAQSILRQGFAVHWLTTYPFGIGLDEVIHNEQTDSWLETLLDRFTNRQFHDRTTDLSQLVNSVKPTLIVLDAFLSTDFVVLFPLLQPLGARAVLLQAMLSTYDDGHSPPLNTSLIPGQDTPQTIRQAWRYHYRRQFINRLWESLKYGGRSRKWQIRWAFDMLRPSARTRHPLSGPRGAAGLPQ